MATFLASRVKLQSQSPPVRRPEVLLSHPVTKPPRARIRGYAGDSLLTGLAAHHLSITIVQPCPLPRQ